MVDDKKIGDDSKSSHASNPIYAVSTQDGTGAKITHVELLGPNYEEWAKGFRVALGAKRKLGFIDGTLKNKPSNPSEVEDWTAINYLIVAWIFNTIEPRVRSSISYRETAFELWEDIRLRFTVGNEIKIYQSQEGLSDCKQKSGESIMDYYGRMKKLWDDINDFDALPSCNCSGCRCDLNATLRKRREADHVRRFLMGLEPFYATVRSQILGTKPLPSIQLVYSRLVQEEEVRSLTQSRDDSVNLMALALRDSNNGKQPQPDKGGRPRYKCTFCTKDVHTESRCWVKHGYPADRDPRRSSTRSGESSTSGTSTSKANVVLGEPPVVTNMILRHGKTVLQWIIDTGASTHVCCDDRLFDTSCSIRPINIGLPNGVNLIARKTGTIKLNDRLVLTNVLFVPTFHYNLLSVSQLLSSQELHIQFTNSQCVIQDRALTTIGVGELSNGLFYLTMKEPNRVNAVTGSAKANIELWHQRMGHPSPRAMEYLPDISCFSRNISFDSCDICFRAKQTRTSFPLSDNKAEHLFDLIHCDVWGPYQPNRSCSSRYFLSIVDDFSRCVWFYLMKTKDEVPRLMRDFFSLIDRQFDGPVKIVRSDNGTELRGLIPYFREHGIIHQTSMVKTPQQNARVERKHRHILNVARALRFQSSLPLDFWGECVLTATYLINRTPTRILQNKTPFELLFQQAPDLSLIRVFGCLCYAKNLQPRDKFDSRSRRCVFIGYPFGKKGWHLFDIETGVYFQSRDVHFIETRFPFANETVSNSGSGSLGFTEENPSFAETSTEFIRIDQPSPSVEEGRDAGGSHEEILVPTNPAETSEQPDDSVPRGTVPVNVDIARSDATGNELIVNNDVSNMGHPNAEIAGDNEASIEEMRRGKRIKFDNIRNKDYVSFDKIFGSFPTVTHNKSRLSYF